MRASIFYKWKNIESERKRGAVIKTHVLYATIGASLGTCGILLINFLASDWLWWYTSIARPCLGYNYIIHIRVHKSRHSAYYSLCHVN